MGERCSTAAFLTVVLFLSIQLPISNQSLEESKSMEELAGMPVQNEPVAEPAPVIPEEAPPLPKEGLPNGWTMEQWKWYGEEWLAKMGK